MNQSGGELSKCNTQFSYCGKFAIKKVKCALFLYGDEENPDIHVLGCLVVDFHFIFSTSFEILRSKL